MKCLLKQIFEKYKSLLVIGILFLFGYCRNQPDYSYSGVFYTFCEKGGSLATRETIQVVMDKMIKHECMDAAQAIYQKASLDLGRYPLENFQAIENLPNLQELTINVSKTTNLNFLKTLPSLEKLVLKGRSPTPINLTPLEKHKYLKNIVIDLQKNLINLQTCPREAYSQILRKLCHDISL